MSGNISNHRSAPPLGIMPPSSKSAELTMYDNLPEPQKKVVKEEPGGAGNVSESDPFGLGNLMRWVDEVTNCKYCMSFALLYPCHDFSSDNDPFGLDKVMAASEEEKKVASSSSVSTDSKKRGRSEEGNGNDCKNDGSSGVVIKKEEDEEPKAKQAKVDVRKTLKKLSQFLVSTLSPDVNIADLTLITYAAPAFIRASQRNS